MEAADAGIKVIIAITEGIPVADMIKANSYVKERNARFIGGSKPIRESLLLVKRKVGIMPGLPQKEL
jgi:succinyl-CoA synthetase alpha subunit